MASKIVIYISYNYFNTKLVNVILSNFQSEAKKLERLSNWNTLPSVIVYSINTIITNADWLTNWLNEVSGTLRVSGRAWKGQRERESERERERESVCVCVCAGVLNFRFYACKGAHTLFADQREREREREGGRERERGVKYGYWIYFIAFNNGSFNN